MSTLLVVICSVRPGRVGKPVGTWFSDAAQADSSFDTVVVADLADLALPFMDEPNHPRMHSYTHQHTRDWSSMVRGSDAVVFVTPEYNYAMSASQKNAIDYLFVEWSLLATGWVSYGGISGGLRSVQHAKGATSTVGCVSVQNAVTIPMVRNHVVDGVFEPTEAHTHSATAMLAELRELSDALAPLRAKRLAVFEH